MNRLHRSFSTSSLTNIMLTKKRFKCLSKEDKYWQNLYDSEEVKDKTLRIGPLIYRENYCDHHVQDIFVRSCYDEIYQECISDIYTELSDIFFTGTSGIGTSIYRSYVVWRQIQEAKKNKSTCIIALTSSPQLSSNIEAVTITDGNLEQTISKFNSNEFYSLTLTLPPMPLLCHVDVASGDITNQVYCTTAYNSHTEYT